LQQTIEPTAQQVTLQVQGMKCAGCVQTVEKALGQQTGVLAATVNLVTEQATVTYNPEAGMPDRLAIILTERGFPAQVECSITPEEKLLETEIEGEQIQRRLWQIGLATVLVVLSLVGHLHQLTAFRIPILSDLWFHWCLATLALLGPGGAMIKDGWHSLRHGTPNMNTLVSLGALTAYVASDVALAVPQLGWECFFDAPVMIVGLVLMGRTLEEQARGRATSAFKALLRLQPMLARQVDPEQPSTSKAIPVAQVQVGMLLQVLPGDKFPVDGVVTTGQSAVNEAMLTGESLPVHKAIGDRVMAGTLNQSDAVIIEATATGAETVLAQIVSNVAAAQARKAPIQRLADQVSGYFVYGIMAIATLTFLFWAFVGTRLWPEVLHPVNSMLAHHLDPSDLPGDSAALLLSLKLAIAVLVVACPCALGLATPTAIVVGTSLGAERGLLIRGGDVLEAVHHLDTVVFDKTGTLTTGQPVVAEYWLSIEANTHGLQIPTQLIQWAVSLEVNTQHPFALAIRSKAAELDLSPLPVTALMLQPGLGLSGVIEQQTLFLGSSAWLAAQGIELGENDRQRANHLAAQGHSVVFLACENALLGGIALRDPLRPDAVATVQSLRQQHYKIMLLTGDQQTTATAIGQQLGLRPEEVSAEILPTAKAKVIQDLQAAGHCVAMVGDGLNDAPALAQADVGIALSSGTDVAIETAQIVLMQNHLTQKEPQLQAVMQVLRLSNATFRTIQQNLFWAIAYNLVGIPLAAGFLLPTFGILLNPATAAAFMAFSSVSVVANSLMLRNLKF
jgi:P-type Cu2+ transporter